MKFQLQHQSFHEYSGLISFRTDWFDHLAVQGTQESSPAPQLETISSLVLTLPYGPTLIHTLTTGKTIALTRLTFIGKGMSLLFNMLPRLVIAFLPRSKPLLISWLQSLSTVILESKKIKSVLISSFSTSIYHEMMGLDAMILVF